MAVQGARRSSGRSVADQANGPSRSGWARATRGQDNPSDPEAPLMTEEEIESGEWIESHAEEERFANLGRIKLRHRLWKHPVGHGKNTAMREKVNSNMEMLPPRWGSRP